jgi:hypothetical protein
MRALENNLVFDTLNAIFTIERAYYCSKLYAYFNNKIIELIKLFFNVFIIRVKRNDPALCFSDRYDMYHINL